MAVSADVHRFYFFALVCIIALFGWINAESSVCRADVVAKVEEVRLAEGVRVLNSSPYVDSLGERLANLKNVAMSDCLGHCGVQDNLSARRQSESWPKLGGSEIHRISKWCVGFANYPPAFDAIGWGSPFVANDQCNGRRTAFTETIWIASSDRDKSTLGFASDLRLLFNGPPLPNRSEPQAKSKEYKEYAYNLLEQDGRTLTIRGWLVVIGAVFLTGAGGMLGTGLIAYSRYWSGICIMLLCGFIGLACFRLLWK